MNRLLSDGAPDEEALDAECSWTGRCQEFLLTVQQVGRRNTGGPYYAARLTARRTSDGDDAAPAFTLLACFSELDAFCDRLSVSEVAHQLQRCVVEKARQLIADGEVESMAPGQEEVVRVRL